MGFIQQQNDYFHLLRKYFVTLYLGPETHKERDLQKMHF
jgi:hypothetical protein